jgi:hypothetical protein
MLTVTHFTNVTRCLSFSAEFFSLYISKKEISTPMRAIIGAFFQEMGPVGVSYESCSLACVAAPMRAIIGAFFQEMGPAV